MRGGKTTLDSVSGGVKSGQLMAILGPSGAGKTTLVELIAGKTKSGQYTGSITFRPYAHGHNPSVAFVPQNDILPAMLTVREALTFAAFLRLTESLPVSSKAALVSTIIFKLGLDAVAETRIGATDGTGRGISGGEARRVSIGLEFVGCPDVLVCNEPTSGLDSVSARRVVNVLKELAREGGVAIGHQGSHGHRKGVAVICSVHQPSSRLYRTFDSVHLLSNGRALYLGPGRLAPAQDFMRMPEGEEPGLPDDLCRFLCPPLFGLALAAMALSTQHACTRRLTFHGCSLYPPVYPGSYFCNRSRFRTDDPGYLARHTRQT